MVVGNDYYRRVATGVDRPQRLHEGKVALAASHQVKHDDLGRHLSGSTQRVRLILSYKDGVALTLEPCLFRRA
jgi:hypothetical protein